MTSSLFSLFFLQIPTEINGKPNNIVNHGMCCSQPTALPTTTTIATAVLYIKTKLNNAWNFNRGHYQLKPSLAPTTDGHFHSPLPDCICSLQRCLHGFIVDEKVLLPYMAIFALGKITIMDQTFFRLWSLAPNN